MFFDPVYFIFVAPAFLLAMFAQMWVKSAFASAMQQPAAMSGARVTQLILDSAGLHDIRIEQIPGKLSDHYDPREKVLRLSPDVYSGRSLASVGIAAHEVGHAIQDAEHYAPLVVRNAAVPLAGVGGNFGTILFVIGLMLSYTGAGRLGITLAIAGAVLFGLVLVFQVINLPVEFNASARAKRLLVDLNVVDSRDMGPVNNVLNAAAMTYVAATLQTLMTLLYYFFRIMQAQRR